jgi:hypothetical protein
VDVSVPILQATIEGMTRNLVLDNAEAREYGLTDHNIAPMRDSASTAKEALEDSLQTGVMSLQLKC